MDIKTYDLIIVGAGPAGTALAAEAVTAGMDREKIMILEKAEKNAWIIRKLYPDQKLVTANYKGLSPVSMGVMRFQDMKKKEALEVLSETVDKYEITVEYGCNVLKVEKVGGSFEISTNKGTYEGKLCAIGIGVFGKPNKPDYRIPPALRERTLFDVTGTDVVNSSILVVGGGDSAAEYVQHLLPKDNKIELSCREKEFTYMNDKNREKITSLGASGEIQVFPDSNIESIEESEGRVKVNFKDQGMESRLYDRIVYALGGTTPTNFLKVSGVEFDKDNPMIDEGNESNVPGLFLIGDLATGRNGGSIILAFNSSETVMKRIQERYSADMGL